MDFYDEGRRGAHQACVYEPKDCRVKRIGFGREGEDRPDIQIASPLGWKAPSDPANNAGCPPNGCPNGQGPESGHGTNA